MKPDQTLALVGGDINLEAATLKTGGGRIELGSVAAQGLVNIAPVEKGFSLNYDDVDEGNIELSQQTAVDASGNGAGDIQVWGRNIKITDGSLIETSTLGSEDGGSLVVNAQESVEVIGNSQSQLFTGLFATVYPQATGKGADLTIKTNNLLVKDDAIIGASTSGKGKGGDITIKTNTLLAKDRVLINASTSGEGNGGNLSIDAQDIQITGDSGLFAASQENSTGDLGNITIKTNTLLVKDESSIFASAFGKGSIGNLSIDAQDVQLIGDSSLSTFTIPNSTGDAGNITINTNNLLVKDGARVDTGTLGQGKGGNLSIDAQDLQLIGDSSLSTLTASTGDAGDITIKTNSLLIKDGASVMTDTMAEGNAGNLTVDAQDVQLIGESKNGQFSSNLSAEAALNSTGDGGDLTIKTNNLLVKDGAQITAATFAQGKGGNLTVDAKNVQLIGKTRDNQFSSGLFTSAAENSTGDAGNLTINTDILQVEDGAKVDVEGRSMGKAGNLIINADSIRLNNDALISANTLNNIDSDTEQATINIKSQELILRRESNIFTNATGENVVGGNINIDTDFLIANENSDISANSENSQGGKVRIDAQAIFGTQFRSQPTPKSDITATGASEDLSGTVEIITPQTDPTSGSIEFPTIPVDTEIADACSTPGYANSSFTITGKGSLPPSPLKPLTGRLNRTKLATLNENEAIEKQQIQTRKKEPSIKPIVEARGWIRTPEGKIILVAYNPRNKNFQTMNNSGNCNL